MSTTVTDRGWRLVVPYHPWGARFARQRLSATLAGVVPRGLLADVEAVATELVCNAVRHADPLPGGVIGVEWWLTGEGVDIRVSDGGSTVAPEVRSVEPEAVSGRGLTIVEALAYRWGFEPEGHGQCVWAQLRGAR